MLIACLIFVSFVVGFFLVVLGVAIGRAGREQLRAESQESRERLATITGAHETLKTCYADVSKIAREAWRLAYERHFPDKSIISPEQLKQLERQFDFESGKPKQDFGDTRIPDPRRFEKVDDDWPDQIG